MRPDPRSRWASSLPAHVGGEWVETVTPSRSSKDTPGLPAHVGGEWVETRAGPSGLRLRLPAHVGGEWVETCRAGPHGSPWSLPAHVGGEWVETESTPRSRPAAGSGLKRARYLGPGQRGRASPPTWAGSGLKRYALKMW